MPVSEHPAQASPEKVRWRDVVRSARWGACRPRVHSPRGLVAASSLSVGSGVIVVVAVWAHLTASARFRGRAPGPVSGRLSATRQLEGWHPGRRFPGAFRPPVFASRLLYLARNWALLTVGLPAERPDLDGVSAFRTHELRPGRAPSIPRGRRCSSRPMATSGRRLPLRSGPSLHPAPASIIAGPAPNEEVNEGSSHSPVRSAQPVAARMERAALGLKPRCSHPADPEPDDARRGGTGHRARTWNYRLNSHSLSISNPVVHSMRATSRRTSPFRSSACRLSDDQSSRHRGRPPAAASRLLQRRNVATAGGRFSGRAAVRTKPIGVLRPVRRARHSIVEISKRARAPRRTGLFARGEDMDKDPESPIAARRATPSYLKGLGGPAYLPRNRVRRRVCGRSVTDGIAVA